MTYYFKTSSSKAFYQNAVKFDYSFLTSVSSSTTTNNSPIVSKVRYSVQVLIIKANEMHYFSNLFDKLLYMFRTGPLSIIRSISTLYTRNRYLQC